MNIRQRARHRLTWFILLPALIAVLLFAVLGRQVYPDQARPRAIEEKK